MSICTASSRRVDSLPIARAGSGYAIHAISCPARCSAHASGAPFWLCSAAPIARRNCAFPVRSPGFGNRLNSTASFDKLKHQQWVVHAKRPFGGPEQVLKYLARYTHRVAISNGRLVAMQDGRVTFRWRDSAHGNQTKLMTLDAVEFIRRFLLHVLPAGLVKIRHFGFLANPQRREALKLCRTLLQTPEPSDPLPDAQHKTRGTTVPLLWRRNSLSDWMGSCRGTTTRTQSRFYRCHKHVVIRIHA